MTTKQAISLFSGAGGDTLGLESAGYTVVAFSENNVNAIATHQANFPHSTLLRNPDTGSTDIRKLPDSVFAAYRGQIDLIFAGFPCFPAGTLVLTNNGYKPIETVSLEEKLLTHTGSFQTILNTQTKLYTGPLYELDIKYHPTNIQATEDHPFYVRTRSRIWNTSTRKYDYTFSDPCWKSAKTLTTEDFTGMVITKEERIPTFNIPLQVNKSLTTTHHVELGSPDEWFLLGYFVGNGWVEDTKKADSRLVHKISLTIPDKKQETILKRIQTVLPVTYKQKRSGASTVWGCSDVAWFSILKEFGKYAHGKRIPEWIHSAPKHLIEEFIAGYDEADGHLDAKGTKRITTVSANLAFGLQRLYLKLGHLAHIVKSIRPKFHIIQGRVVNQRDTYVVNVKLNKQRSVRSFIDVSGNFAWYAIRSIQVHPNTTPIPVYNFEVEHDNSYIVENTVVHNCQSFSHAGKKNPNDPRGELVHEFVRVVRLVRPRWIIGENVKGLLSRKGHDPADPVGSPTKPVIDIICRIFKAVGYNLSYKIVDATEVGVPQLRKRLILVGLRSTQFWPHLAWPLPTQTQPQVRPLLETHLRGATRLRETPPDLHFLIPTTETAPTGESHPNLRRLAAGLRNRSSKEKEADPTSTVLTITEPDGLISFGSRRSGYHGEVIDPDKPSKTIICTYNLCPRLFVGLRDPTGAAWLRTLSVQELQQIQGFPADFVFHGDEKAQIIQIGNAVPPPLAAMIARALQNCWCRPFPYLYPQGDQGDIDEED